MIQLRILSGKMAGDTKVVRHFPFHIGRAGGNHLRLEDSGVWDRHLTLEFDNNEGITLQTAPDTFAAVNENRQTFARLRNGDIISFGSAKVQFWLVAPRQRSLILAEMFVWLLLAGVTAAQTALIYQLTR